MLFYLFNSNLKRKIESPRAAIYPCMLKFVQRSNSIFDEYPYGSKSFISLTLNMVHLRPYEESKELINSEVDHFDFRNVEILSYQRSLIR